MSQKGFRIACSVHWTSLWQTHKLRVPWVWRDMCPEFFAEGEYLNLPGLEYAVSPDGSRILVVRSVGGPTTTTLNVVTNSGPVARDVDHDYRRTALEQCRDVHELCHVHPASVR